MSDSNRYLARILFAGLFVAMALGCNGRSPSAPGQSNPGQPTVAALTVLTIAPNSGVPDGGTAVAVFGSGFQTGATLSFGGTAASVIVESGTTIMARTPPHAIGTVDVVVTNRDGRSAALIGGYTFAPAPPVPPPAVASISPGIGSTRGGAPVTITGTGFQGTGYQSGIVVTLGDAVITPGYANSTTIWAEVPAHAAGRVDVVVTNSDGQIGRLAEGFTFASPQSFDFNGTWESDGHDAPPVRFTIQDGAVTSVQCGTSATLTFAPPVPVSDGEFSFSADDGVAFSGRIVSPSIARGTINMAPCLGMTWYAAK